MPLVSKLAELDKHQNAIKALIYEWCGGLGLPGRRYCTRSDPRSGRRTVQLHCYEVGSTEITWHPAFRDDLRAPRELAAEYDYAKAECEHRHPGDCHAYGDCKEAWIRNAEATAWTGIRRNKPGAGASLPPITDVSKSAIKGEPGMAKPAPNFGFWTQGGQSVSHGTLVIAGGFQLPSTMDGL
jgi:hypothetical protein